VSHIFRWLFVMVVIMCVCMYIGMNIWVGGGGIQVIYNIVTCMLRLASEATRKVTK
jgi:hypothetical protein